MAIDHLESTVVDLFDTWATRTPNAIAVEWNEERLTYAGLRNASLHVSKALLCEGVRPGDKIPILSHMSLELLPAILGALRVGACYVAIDMAGWSTARVDATLKNISPRVAIATHQANTRSIPVVVDFQELWLQSPFDDTDGTCNQLDAVRQNMDNKALVYVSFTSGTTGKPKGVMIYHRALYQIIALTTDNTPNIAPGDRVLQAFSISFDACASVIWKTIAWGGAVVMASWSTFPEIATTCDILSVTPSMLAALDTAGSYNKVRCICVGAEAPNFDLARQWITPARKVVHGYGPSEATINITYGRIPEDTEPDLGVLNPGVEVFLVDDNLQESDVGEILISGPCLAAGYLNDPELTARKFIDWNGKRVYRTGDLARRTEKGLSWVGRADRIVKNRGFLVNLETEVESAILRFTDVRATSVFMWRGKLMGFVQPSTVNVEELRVFMKENFDPFIVPDEILALNHFPLTVHGKVDRVALHTQLEDKMAREDLDLNTMACTTPHDALRWAFAKCLQVPFGDLERTSSFSRLGGNSLAAIRLSMFLRQKNYAIKILQILKEDTIGHLEEKLTKIDEQDGAPDSNVTVQTESEAVPATDMHRLMLTQSQDSPVTNCLVGRAKFTGPRDSVPTPSELRVAWTATLAAHEIFKTRYDTQNWTLHKLDRVNLDWEEYSVEAEEFDDALFSIQERVWAHQRSLKRLDLEVPYCHMTCVYTPGRKAIGFVWRIHHVFSDIFSFVILTSDLEHALAKKQVAPGPSIRDFSRFMQKYKDDKLDIATDYWKHMMQPLCDRSLFDFQPPQQPVEGDAWRVLSFPTKETLESVEASVRAYKISSATLTFAAWALVLNNYTSLDYVSFYLSRSGRMVPWPPAPFLVAAMNCRVPFGTGIPAEATVQEWLAEMDSTLLNVAELENLCQSLEKSIYPSEHFKTAVQAFLYMPQLPASWEVQEKLTGQAEQIGMVWRVQTTHKGAVEAELEIDQRVVDIAWATEVGELAVQMFEGLVNARQSIKLQDLT
ncbi:hypothetical protein CFE70_007161 [Pyrenophora teres f. teres 0-1]|uniref:Carrier domain-containing protein n=1 Tax=Pyrenophora teres f. teres (strain 0-1) TaxID=861557 RepID=E3RMU9_PYRTT|nr:hypothetical protein PTT_09827 [Pyrenophora teres f. teres 0-1]KAE8843580.1 hypothetical protein HRS9122_04683 [Pyrenophora teres f. teres]KAE8856633.1 hypothetical protein PTNB73_09355 [Pyrenophora teres f. teres]KAK1908545.1 hypothetical protein P3342_009395 [Pyrenophora teres f. teres]